MDDRALLMAMVTTTACLAGCFDFSRLGPPAADLAAPMPDIGDGLHHCATNDDCGSGENCIGGGCHAADTGSCAALHGDHPELADGIYWLAGGHRVYCDMRLGAELCADQSGPHSGQTRDRSALPVQLMSVLSSDGRACRLWAVASGGYPLAPLSPDFGAILSTCQALGFPGDITVGDCKYGDNPGYTNCGFMPPMPDYVYTNHCIGCLPDLSVTYKSDGYLWEGIIHRGDSMSSQDGSVSTLCRTGAPSPTPG